MGILRTIRCDMCGAVAAEDAENQGWSGWGAVHGIQFNGVSNPTLCAHCLAKVAQYMDKEVNDGMD